MRKQHLKCQKTTKCICVSVSVSVAISTSVSVSTRTCVSVNKATVAGVVSSALMLIISRRQRQVGVSSSDMNEI